MPSWQARCANAMTRALVRRRGWGSERALVRRARMLFGAPPIYGALRALGLRRERVREADVHGEWIIPPHARPGAVLYVHGGGYVSCSISTHRPIAAGLARRCNTAVFSLEYRRAPEHRFPAALDDVERAYRWLFGRRDGAPIAIAGDSAGGGLALALAMRARDLGWPAPSCVVCFSPWMDLAGTSATMATNDGRCAMFRPENIDAFARIYLGDASPRDPRASPVYGDLAALPPILLQVGSTELLLGDARGVHSRVTAAGGRSRLSVYDDVLHCWHMLDGLVPESAVALDEAAAFILEEMTMTDPKRPTEPRDAEPLDRPRDDVDEAVEESFPASDPPSWEPLHSGTPKTDDRGAEQREPDGR